MIRYLNSLREHHTLLYNTYRLRDARPSLSLSTLHPVFHNNEESSSCAAFFCNESSCPALFETAASADDIRAVAARAMKI